MGTAAEGDVIRILLEQHARIRDLFDEIESARDEHKKMAFDDLRALLAVHETAEELILRPVSKTVAGGAIARARDNEEGEANRVLADLEKLDVSTSAFDSELSSFRIAVDKHADGEESEEFPRILTGCDRWTRAAMGRRLARVESMAPTHPHPFAAGSSAAQWTVGPFAAILDRVRDALSA
jgi:hypothetical protein